MSFITNFHSVPDPSNSTTANLPANGVFIGVGKVCTGYNSVCLFIDAGPGNSSSNGVQIQFSDNNIWNGPYTTGSTTTGIGGNSLLTIDPTDSTSALNSFIMISNGPFSSQSNNILALNSNLVTMPSMWIPVNLTGTIGSVQFTGTNQITITGVGFNIATPYITIGTTIQLYVNFVLQNFLINAVPSTYTSTSIVLSTTNSTVVNPLILSGTILSAVASGGNTLTISGVGVNTRLIGIGDTIQLLMATSTTMVINTFIVTAIPTNTATSIILTTTGGANGTTTGTPLGGNITSVVVTNATTAMTITITGTNLSLFAIIIGSTLQLLISNVLQTYQVTYITTATTTSIVLLASIANTNTGTATNIVSILNIMEALPGTVSSNPVLTNTTTLTITGTFVVATTSANIFAGSLVQVTTATGPLICVVTAIATNTVGTIALTIVATTVVTITSTTVSLMNPGPIDASIFNPNLLTGNVTSAVVASNVLTIKGTNLTYPLIQVGSSLELLFTTSTTMTTQNFTVSSIGAPTSNLMTLSTTGGTNGTSSGIPLQGNITSVIVSSVGTVLTIIGTGLSTNTITVGSCIQVLIASVLQTYTVTSLTTISSVLITLVTSGNTNVGTAINIVGVLNSLMLLPGTVTSAVVAATTLTIGGTFNVTTVGLVLFVGSIIQITLAGILQNYVITSVTITATTITLGVTNNATTGTATVFNVSIINSSVSIVNAVVSLTSPGSGWNYSTGMWTSEYTSQYIASINFTETYNFIKQYYRVLYINGITAQTSFNMTSYLSPVTNNMSVVLEDTNTDLYGNFEVVEPKTVLEFKCQPYTNTINTLTTIVYSTTPSITAAVANATMIITAVPGTPGTLICQSKQYCLYQPGKTMVLYATGLIGATNNTSGVTCDIGIFDTPISPTQGGNGIFYSFNSITGISINIFNSRTGLTVNIPQYLWNVDKMDGTGTSNIKVNFATIQFFIIRFTWVGIGLAQFGFNCMGNFVVCHVITNYNVITLPITSCPNLPIRFRMTTTTSSDSGTLVQSASSILVEGGHNPEGLLFSCSNGAASATGIAITSGVETPMLAITGACNTTIGPITPTSSLTNTYYHNLVRLLTISKINTTITSTMLVSVRLYPAGTPYYTANIANGVNGTTWTDSNTIQSIIKFAQGGTVAGTIPGTSGGTFTTVGSILLYQEYIYGRSNPVNLNMLTNSYSTIGSDSQNICDIIIVTGMGCGAAVTGLCSLTWEELQ
jgi:hypothetical protein